jgi:hypothetical protein
MNGVRAVTSGLAAHEQVLVPGDHDLVIRGLWRMQVVSQSQQGAGQLALCYHDTNY